MFPISCNQPSRMGRPGDQLTQVPILDMVETGSRGTQTAVITAFQKNREVEKIVPTKFKQACRIFGDFSLSVSHGIILSTPGRIHTITQFESDHQRDSSRGYTNQSRDDRRSGSRDRAPNVCRPRDRQRSSSDHRRQRSSSQGRPSRPISWERDMHRRPQATLSILR